MGDNFGLFPTTIDSMFDNYSKKMHAIATKPTKFDDDYVEKPTVKDVLRNNIITDRTKYIRKRK